jgi:hypothetical protein
VSQSDAKMRLLNSPAFLTPTEIEFEVSLYEYKRDWKLTTFFHPWEGMYLYVTGKVTDSTNHTRSTELRISSPMPPMPSREYLGYWLTWRLMRIETHEVSEFLRRVGERVIDPHVNIEPAGQDG